MRKIAVLTLILVLLTGTFCACTTSKEYNVVEKYYVYNSVFIEEKDEYQRDYTFYFVLEGHGEKFKIKVTARDYLIYNVGDKYTYKK